MDVSAQTSPLRRTSDSGLQCLIFAARHHGIHLTLEQIKREHLTQEGVRDLEDLTLVAQACGLKTEIITTGFFELLNFTAALPALIELHEGKYVLLTGVNGSSNPQVVMILDPTAENPTSLPIDMLAFARIWTGRVCLLKRNFDIEDKDQPFGLRWLMGQLMRERRMLIDIGIAGLVMTVLALAPVVFFLIVLNKVFQHSSYATLNVLVVGLLLAIGLDTVMGYLRRYVTLFVARRIDTRLNVFLYDRVLNLPIDYFERTPTGVIAGNVNEVWRVRNFMTGPLFTTCVDLLTLVVLIPVMFIMSWQLSFVVLGLVAIMIVTVYFWMPEIQAQYIKVVKAEQTQYSQLIETLYGMRTIKSLALNPRKRREWDTRVARAVHERFELGRISNWPATILQPIEKLLQVGTVGVGTYIILAGSSSLDIGILIAFNLLGGRVIAPLLSGVQMINQLEEVRGAIGMVSDVLNRTPEEGRGPNGVRLPIRGALSFENVRFTYEGAATPALDDVSFKVPQGSILGIMGRSGSGKTTVTRLMQGLHSRYAGLVKVDGIDLRQYDIDHLRRNIGVVLQENFLFRGTIRENICGARIDASFDEVVRAAQLAGAEEFIERMPRGYETMIEEGAANLSGGQRQRLAIARALILEPPILILDEATSALDAESEAIVNANLLQIAQGRTLIVISHRLSALVPANQILVMEKGKILDVGPHDDLVQRSELYRGLWNQQNAHILKTQRPAGGNLVAALRP